MKVKDYMMTEQENQEFYAGHLPNGNAVQKHSAGDLYPVIMVSKGKPNELQHGYSYAGYVDYYSNQGDAVQMAQRVKQSYDTFGAEAARELMKILSQGVKLNG